MVLSAISVFIGLLMIFSFLKSKFIDKKAKYTDFGRTSSVFCALPFLIIAILFYFSPVEIHAFYSYLWLGVATPFFALFISAEE
jgi:Na+/proline symporter